VPEGGFTITVLVDPSSTGVVTALLQCTVATPLVFCCSVKPVEADGQERLMVES